MERISDYAENIAEYEGEFKARRATLSEKALEELKALTEASLKSIDYSLRIFAKDDFHELPKADRLEQDVDDLQTDFINNHIQRLMNNECDPVGGVLFTDMVNDLERCSDHAINIAYALFHNTPEHHNAQA
jgi:phosphate:Na+ symporter